MCEQLDLWPDTVTSPMQRLEEQIETYMAMWRADRRVDTLIYLMRAIEERLALQGASDSRGAR